MSLSIDPDTITEVLLADGWHAVHGESFYLDAYEYVDDTSYILHGGGDSGICSTGFAFTETLFNLGGTRIQIAGPLTSILAVRTKA